MTGNTWALYTVSADGEFLMWRPCSPGGESRPHDYNCIAVTITAAISNVLVKSDGLVVPKLISLGKSSLPIHDADLGNLNYLLPVLRHNPPSERAPNQCAVRKC